MPPLRQITFVLDEFALQTPAQQLLDRFLLGYRRDGQFHRVAGIKVVAHLAADAASTTGENSELSRRVADHGLRLAPTLADALRTADAIVLVPRSTAIAPAEALVTAVLEQAPRGAACFIHGALAANLAAAQTALRRAELRQILLAAGTALPLTWRLPQVDLPAHARVAEALIVVQGPSPLAELHALDGLLPLLERRAGGERGVRRVKFLAGPEMWRAANHGDWSWPLLSSALSRSDSPQGNTLLDGRTQDLVGRGVVPGLARDPRGWLLEHTDGVRSALLVLDGVVADYNFAIRLQNGREISAQLFRAPVPAQEQFTPLVAALENFFRTGNAPWPAARSLLTAGLLDQFRTSSDSPGRWFPILTPAPQ